MGLSKDFNQPPYFDDFSEDKNFHRVLFKPGVAVQARELTQMQTILQKQVERFGDNILTEGTIISGCNFNEIQNIGYVKILDLQGNGAPVSMPTYKGHKAVGLTTGVEAIVTEVISGLESQSPNLNSLFVNYLTTGTNGEKEFSETETIDIIELETGNLVANVFAAGTVETNSVGKSYAVRVGDGIIYQKGFFIGVEEQLTIVTKYTNIPDGLVVGFETTESIVTSSNDTSLLDNAQGFPNFNAPGADRIKLSPVLVTKTVAEAISDEKFFAIQEYENGKIVRRNNTTQYSKIFDEIQKRTFEESGNYTIRDFKVSVSENSANTSQLDVNIGSGLAYIEGRRVELLNAIDVQIDKAVDTATETAQNVATNYGHYILVDEYMGNVSFDLSEKISLHSAAKNRATAGSVGTYSAGDKIGNARVRAITFDSGTPGTNTAKYRVYIFDIQMDSGKKFDDVRSVFYNGTAKGVADIVLENGKASIKESSFSANIFNVGRSAIKTIPTATADYIYRERDQNLSVDSATGDLVINLSGNNEWPYGVGALNATQKTEIVLISNATQAPYTSGKPIDLSTATVTVNSSQSMTIALATAPAADMSVIVYYNAKKTSAAPSGKDLKTVYVKLDAATHTNGTSGKYSLGLPDVYKIEGIWQGSTYSESETKVTGKFRLVQNQNDSFYGIDYLQSKRGHNIGASDKILIKLKVFKKNTSGSFGVGYFNVDSYPIDDADPSNPSAITTQEIPVFKTASGKRYDLRDALDFRLFPDAVAAYGETIGAATINPADTLNFSGSAFAPTPNEAFEGDYEYYLGRRDIVYIDAEGKFQTLTGVADETPAPPSEPLSGLVLATLNIPPYPSLPKGIADRLGKPEYAVTMLSRNNQRYTMKDIGGIQRRLQSLEYYTALSILEQSAVNMLVTDDNGQNRFKNGIFVDNFNDLKIANLKDKEYSAGIDLTLSEITPKFRSYPLDLKPWNEGAWSGTSKFAQVAALKANNIVKMIEQPYATTSRNCVTDFYSYNGQVRMSPSYDGGYDTTRAPEITLDITQAFSDFVEELNEYIPLSSVSRDVATARTSETSGRTTTTTTSTVTTTTSNSLEVENGNSERIGDFVTDVRFSPFMRGRVTKVLVHGLRPNTEHHFFFDGENVDEFVSPGRLRSGALSAFEIAQIGPNSDSIKTDSNGTLFAIFRIPDGRFFVGDRKLEILDVDLYSEKSSATSKGSFMYRGFNYNVERAGLSTRMPEFSSDAVVTVSEDVSVRRETTPMPRRENDGPPGQEGGARDPIAQTFMVDRGFTNDNAVFVSKMEVFFKTKSASKGVTLQIREVDNGYPSGRIVPFTNVHLNASDVAVSDDSSLATVFKFEAPIALKSGKEYAFVVIPDGNSPDYRVFVSKTGQTDLISSAAVTQDSGSGTLFTSTNNRTWTPYQDENIKFTLFKDGYSTAGGHIFLTNNNHEFLDVSGITGTFKVGEKVGVNKANAAGTVSVTKDSTSVVGTGTSFNSLQIGDDFVVIRSNGSKEILKISSIANNTNLTVKDAPYFTESGRNYFVSVTGTVASVRTNEPARIILEDSSAKTGQFFANGNVIFGEDSGATATITNVGDQNISYMQPNISRVSTTLTSMKLFAETITKTNGTTFGRRLPFNANAYLVVNESVVKSRSNEIKDGTGKSLVLKVEMDTKTNSTPIVDYETSLVNIFEYIINDDVTDEETPDGAALTKYVSKTVELADGLDADDLKVYLTGYRPTGADISVFVRFQNPSDPRKFEEIEWTKLKMKSETSAYSSTANRFDYKEFEFNVEEKGTFTNGGGAGLNTTDGTLRYKDENGIIYDRYKNYAIKIVMSSDSYRRVPRIKDVRAISLS